MTKEEILKKSQSDNGGKDIEDLDVQRSAATTAYFSSMGFCLLVTILCWIFTKTISVQCWVVFFGMLSTAFFVKYFKLKKLHELFVALSYLLIFVCLVVVYVLQLTGRLGNIF